MKARTRIEKADNRDLIGSPHARTSMATAVPSQIHSSEPVPRIVSGTLALPDTSSLTAYLLRFIGEQGRGASRQVQPLRHAWIRTWFENFQVVRRSLRLNSEPTSPTKVCYEARWQKQHCGHKNTLCQSLRSMCSITLIISINGIRNHVSGLQSVSSW